MKVLQLIDTLRIGGAERMSVNIANALAQNEYSNMLIATREGGTLQKQLLPDVKYCCLSKMNRYDISALLRLRKVIVFEKPEIVHAHSNSVFWAVLIKLMTPGFKLIWHDHNGNRKNTNNFIIKLLSVFIDGVICVNDDLREWAFANLKVSNSRIVYISNFPFYLPFTKTHNVKKTILILANLRPIKDHITLLKCIKILVDRGEDMVVNFVGSTHDVNCVSNIHDEISAHSLQNTIFIKGPVDDVRDALSGADIGVLSSVSEGLPVSLLEYGLAGLPVVCTDVGQCREVLCNNRFGWLVPPKDPQAMADVLSLILNNMESANAIGQNFKNHILEEFGAEAFLKKYNELLARL